MTQNTITPGLKFRSKYFQGIVEVLQVDDSEDKLTVRIQRDEENYHTEEWILSHTQYGFKNGTYSHLLAPVLCFPS